MLSRRTFLATSLGFFLAPEWSLAKRTASVKQIGPHSLVKQEWPPAIVPDFVSVVNRGYGLLADQSGRLAIVEMKREEGPLVIGELTGFAKKIIDLVTTQHRAYAIVAQEGAAELQYFLLVISIMPAQEPTVIARLPLSYLAEPTCLAVNQDIVAVAGLTARGENQVQIYNLAVRVRANEAVAPIATLACEFPVSRLDLQDRQLVVLQTGPTTNVDVYGLLNPANPEKIARLPLDGSYAVLARSKDVLAVAGQPGDKKTYVVLIALRPAPHVVSKKMLPAAEILDMAMRKGQLLLLVNQANRQAVVPVNFGKLDKNLSLVMAEPVLLRGGSNGASAKAKIVVRENEAFVASDWGGVQVLSITKTGWQYLYSHTIPRLPAAGVALSANNAIITGADIKVYNISQPQHPTLLSVTELGAVIRAVATVKDSFLALTREELSLRSIDKPTEVLSAAKVQGQSLAYDVPATMAYVLSTKEQNTTVYPFSVEQCLAPQPSFELAGQFQRGCAQNGRLLVHGLNNLALWQIQSGAEPVASRTFPNFAIRDVELLADTAVITAVDSASKGFLLVLNILANDLPVIGTVDLPNDAVALSVSGRRALVIGRGSHGKDLASIVDISSPACPKVVSSLPVLEAAAAVAIEGQLAVVAGRGLEILSLA